MEKNKLKGIALILTVALILITALILIPTDSITGREHTLTIEIQGEGSTSPAPGNHTYEEGTNITIEPVEDAENWYFQEWTGDIEQEAEEIEITMDQDYRITGHFEEYYFLNVNMDGEGQIQVDPEKEKYDPDEEVTLTAQPEEGWQFFEWTGDHTRIEHEITLIMNEDKNITADFREEIQW